MRYPVSDRFAVELSGQLYPRLLEQGQPVARALALALPPALDACSAVPVAAAVTALYAGNDGDPVLRPPLGKVALDLYAERMAHFPPEQPVFVGRGPAMIAANAALAPGSGRAGAFFLGPRGIGTTSCALELAYQHRGRAARLAWWTPSTGGSLGSMLPSLGAAWSAQLGIPLDRELSDLTRLEAFLPNLRALLRAESLILVLDDLSALLSPAATWRDPRWERLFAVLTGHGGDSRVILTSDVAPAGLDEHAVPVQRLSRLSLLETVQVMNELPNVRGLLRPSGAGTRSSGVPELAAVDGVAARRLLTLTDGHPGLLTLADRVLGELGGVAAGRGDAADARLHRALLARVERGDDDEAIGADLRRALTKEGTEP